MSVQEQVDPIKHVVLLMLENRSFDQMLGSLSMVYPDLDGVRQSGEPYSNFDADGRRYDQQRNSELQMPLDPDHDNGPVLRQLEGGNSGFVKDFVRKFPKSSEADRLQIMGFYEFAFLQALHTLGDNFVVCDRWFSSLPGPTWPNRFFALSGTSRGHVRMPESIWHPYVRGFFEQTQTTIFDRLNEANRDWTIYFYDTACSWVLVNQRKPENLARYQSMDLFFDHAASGELPDFVFIEPKYNGHAQNDDHPPHNVMKGEKFVADVYNAIRTSPLWNECLLVVVFDEHGGFFDHVPPPAAVPPDEHVSEYAFDRLGVRVPAILVSPWLARGVDHTVFDHTSLLRYLSDKWNLGPLGARVAAANSIAKAMKFLTEPRTDAARMIRVRNSDLYAPFPEWEEFDTSGHHRAFEVFAGYLERAGKDVPETKKPGSLGLWMKIARNALRSYIGRRLIRWGLSLSSAREEGARRTTKLRSLVQGKSPDSA